MRNTSKERICHTFSQPRERSCVSRCQHDTSLSRGPFVRFLLLTGMICILLVAFIRDGKSTYAATFRIDDDPVRTAVDLAKPAVVRIITTTSGRLVVHFPTGDVTFPQSGGTYDLQLSGTGTFISAHGDIVTADHVVSPPAQVLAEVAAPDITNYINQHNHAGMPLTVDDVKQAIQTGQLLIDARYGAKSSEVYLDTDYTGPLSTTSILDIPATLQKKVASIEKESAFNQEDVAIVHTSFSDTASVQLGDSSTVQEQDQLTIIGFPGNGDVSMKPTDLLNASVNTLTVSSFKTTDSGAPLIQVGGNVEQGDSGGPVLDSNGKIVGIASFFLRNGSQGATSFLQASISAQKLVRVLNLDMTPGNFQRKWNQALTDYSATTLGHWHKTAQEMTSIAAVYPLFQAVTPYLQNAQFQEKTEPMPVSHPLQRPNPSRASSLTLIVWTCAVATLLLLSILICFSALRYQGKRKRRRIAQSGVHPVHPSDAYLPQQESIGIRPQIRSFPSKDHHKEIHVLSQQSLTPLLATQSLMPSSRPVNPSDAICLWPCRHMNRPDSHFCRICGKPALPPTIQHKEVQT